MSHKAQYPGMTERRRVVGGSTQTVVVLSCACCANELAVPVPGSRKPPDVILTIASRRGWTNKKANHFCPEHRQ